LLGRCFTTWTMPQALFWFSYFFSDSFMLYSFCQPWHAVLCIFTSQGAEISSVRHNNSLSEALMNILYGLEEYKLSSNLYNNLHSQQRVNDGYK
jgi:hypothetical protein